MEKKVKGGVVIGYWEEPKKEAAPEETEKKPAKKTEKK